jgi:hypothetical protein
MCEKKEITITFEEPLLSIPSIDDGCNDENKEHSDDSYSLSNVGTKMNDIFLIPSFFFHFHKKFSPLCPRNAFLSLFVFDYFSRLFLGFFHYI